MSNYNKNISEHESDERYSALYSNTNAIQAIASAVEGTLGPKGLDTMLVDSTGKVIITNDGVTILNKMEASHPAAKMLIQVARSQQKEVGDGTTTATILSSQLLTESVNQINKGVPIPKLIKGIKEGIVLAIQYLKDHARNVENDDSLLYQIAYVAGREHNDVASLIIEAVNLLGIDKIKDSNFKFADSIVAHEGYDNELIFGLTLSKKPMNPQMPKEIENVKLLVIQDGFEPEQIDEEALGTEAGFTKYLQLKEEFKHNIQKIKSMGVNFIAVERGVDPIAEEFCVDHQIMVIQRLNSEDMRKIVDHTGARTIKRTGLNKHIEELQTYLGNAQSVCEDKHLNKVRITKGRGVPVATILVGASTGEIVEERERISKDAASSVQAAIKGGYVPGGGSIELYISKQIEKYREHIRGMEGFGLEVVALALRKPMAQIIANAGFNPLEKVEEAKAAQSETNNDALGIDSETGKVINMEQAGVVDPVLVKQHALKAAGEITEAILRIHSIIRMKSLDD